MTRPSGVNFWIRLFWLSATKTLPALSVPIPSGSANWPGFLPPSPPNWRRKPTSADAGATGARQAAVRVRARTERCTAREGSRYVRAVFRGLFANRQRLVAPALVVLLALATVYVQY